MVSRPLDLLLARQEQQHVAARGGGAFIHLQTAPAWRDNDAVGAAARQIGGAVGAFAIGDDDLDAAQAIDPQRIQRRFDRGCLVQRRHDD